MDRFTKVFSFMVVASLVACGLVIVASTPPVAADGILPAFASYDQMQRFVSGSQSGTVYSPAMDRASNGAEMASTTTKHSETNVQVQGVDEADMVKTDGTHLFIAEAGVVHIVLAYPPESMANVTNISVLDYAGAPNSTAWISGIYLFGQKLAVIASITGPYPSYGPGIMAPMIWRMPDSKTQVLVFNVSDPAHPTLSCSYAISGSPNTSRLANGTVYVVAQDYIWMYQNALVRPKLWMGEIGLDIAPSSVHYDPQTQEPSSLVNLLSVNLENCASGHTSLLVGYSSVVYMSQGALYLTYQKWTSDVRILMPGGAVSSASADTGTTTIYKVALNGTIMTPTAKADVPGWLLNQFSMDEKDGMLRLATTTSWADQRSGVYVLSNNLTLLGKLDGIAPNERIYSSRFVGDTLYLVTFRQVDPLFVIDLSDPANIRVKGELQLPGFSSYLHPIDATHLIGLGMLNGSVKLSLFDVSDPSHPAEVANLSIPGWSYSNALWDHKAVLFDPLTGKLVIPITAYDQTTWNCTTGTYVFKVNGSAIKLDGTVVLQPNEYVVRTHTIGGYLYTVTGSRVIVNDLSNLSLVNEMIYSAGWSYYLPYMAERGGTIAIGAAASGSGTNGASGIPM